MRVGYKRVERRPLTESSSIRVSDDAFSFVAYSG